MIREIVKLRYLHITPRKARLIANLIKGLPVNEAEAQLMIGTQRANEPILKLLKSGIANMANNRKIDSEKLIIEKITVDNGPSFKRFLPRAMGRATPILKRTCHITIILKETEKKKPAKFNTARPKKEKEAKKIAKKGAGKSFPKQEAKEAGKKEAPASKQSFVKRMFMRKSV